MKKNNTNKTKRNPSNKLDHEIIKALRGASFSSTPTRSFKKDLHHTFLQKSHTKKNNSTAQSASLDSHTTKRTDQRGINKKRGLRSPFVHQNRMVLLGALSLLLVVSSTIALRKDRGSDLPFSVEMAYDDTPNNTVRENLSPTSNEENDVIAEVYEKNETRVPPDEERVAQTPSTPQATTTVIDNNNLLGTPQATINTNENAIIFSQGGLMDQNNENNLTLSVAPADNANIAATPPLVPQENTTASSAIKDTQSINRTYTYSEIFQSLENFTEKYANSNVSTSIRQAKINAANPEGQLSTIRGHESGKGFTEEILLNNPNTNEPALVIFYNSDNTNYYGNVYIKRNDGNFVKTHEVHARDSNGFQKLSLDLRQFFYGE